MGTDRSASGPAEAQIVILIPAWNEASRIKPVIEGASGYAPVIVIDDGSQDQTAAIARTAGAVVLEQGTNQGKGLALQAGFEFALRRGCVAVLTLDADGQHDPADIPRFLQSYQSTRADLIIGRRDWGKAPFPRSWTNPFGSWMLSRILRTPIYDSQSGFRMHSSRLLEALQIRDPGFAMETELIIQAVRLGFGLEWVPIRTLYGVGEVSYFHPLYDTWDFLRMLWYAAGVMRQKPDDPPAV